MERRRGRKILGAGARWGLTAVAVLLVGVIGFSFHRVVSRSWRVAPPDGPYGGAIGFGRGTVEWISFHPTTVVWFVPEGGRAAWELLPVGDVRQDLFEWWPPYPRMESKVSISEASVPLWPWALASGAGAFWLWRGHLARRRRERAGCCACGYSRAGLSAGAACPECGKGAAGAGA